MQRAALLAGAAAALLSPPPGAAAVDCAAFDLRNVKLITFDVFAALMDTPTALRNAGYAALGSELGASGVDALVTCWIADYASYAGKTFNATLHGTTPFVWVSRDGLAKCLAQAGALDAHPPGSAAFEALAGSAWRQLTPWPGTGEVLERLNRRWPLATLSNGDAATLRVATRAAFEPAGVTFSTHYSSDDPVMAFKPHPAMYAPAVAAAGGDPAGVLHVAGGAADAAGARAAGIPTVLLRASAAGTTASPCWELADISQLEQAIGYSVPAAPSGTRTPAGTGSPSRTPPAPVPSPPLGPPSNTPTRSLVVIVPIVSSRSATPTATGKRVGDGGGGGGGGGSVVHDGGVVVGLLLAGAAVGAAALAGGLVLLQRRRRLQRGHALAAAASSGGNGGEWAKPPAAAPGRASVGAAPSAAAAGGAAHGSGSVIGRRQQEEEEEVARVNPVRSSAAGAAATAGLWG